MSLLLLHIRAEDGMKPIIIYRLGVVPLENTWMPSWKDFFVERRLKDRLMACESYPYSFLKLRCTMDEIVVILGFGQEY